MNNVTQNLKQQLKKLVELQKVDEQIYGIKTELTEKPAVVEELKQQYELKKARLNDLEVQAKEIQVDRKSKELALQTKEGEINKLEAQLIELKTNKEYQARLMEIESQKADKSRLEEEVLHTFDQTEAIDKDIALEKEKLSAEEKAYLDEKKKVDDLVIELNAQNDRFGIQRKELAKEIDGQVLSRYERLVEGKDGIALVPLAGQSCSGCHMNVPPQTINAIKMYKELVSCEICARLIYIEDDL